MPAAATGRENRPWKSAPEPGKLSGVEPRGSTPPGINPPHRMACEPYAGGMAALRSDRRFNRVRFMCAFANSLTRTALAALVACALVAAALPVVPLWAQGVDHAD